MSKKKEIEVKVLNWIVTQFKDPLDKLEAVYKDAGLFTPPGNCPYEWNSVTCEIARKER